MFDCVTRLNNLFPEIFEFYFKNFVDKQITYDFIPNKYLFFGDVKQINNWAKNYIEYFSDKEAEYNTSRNNGQEYLPHGVFSWYAGYYSHKINAFLRNNEDSTDKEFISKRIEIIKSEMKQFELKDNIVAIRRLANRYIDKKKIQVGMTIIDKGFLSTSLDLSYRKDNECRNKPIDNETILLIKIPSGQNAIYLEPVSKRQEYELLLPNDTKLLIEKTKKVLNNNIILAKVLTN